jgi:hypothetical protein
MSGVSKVAARPAWFATASLGLLLASMGCQPTADGTPTFDVQPDPVSPGGGNGPTGPGGDNPGGGGGEGVSPQSTDTGLTPPGTPLADCATPGPQALRRLTGPQFRNTLVSIFGGDIFDGAQNAPPEGVLTDPANLGFKIDADALVVSNLDSELLMNYSESIVANAAQKSKFAQYTNNCTDANNADCRRGFIQRLGEKAYRQPLNDQQVQEYDTLFQADFAGTSFDERAQTVAIAMLQSPNMLYRREIGAPGSAGQFNLSQFEIASQLSYLLTDGPPDDQLMAAAKANMLSDRATLDAQAERLLATPAGKETMAEFLDGWIETEKLYDKAKDPAAGGTAFTPEVRAAMLQETHLLFQDAYANGGSVETLFTADYTYVNGPLAAFYGIQGVTGNEFVKVPLPANRAPGILGHAAYLTSHAQPENSSPVQRAFIVRERILCQELPPVPQNLDTNLDAPGGFTTNRERYTEHSSNDVCYACHRRMDPIGFSFEHYDGFGRYREVENNTPVDSTGELSDVPGGPIPLTGVNDLADYLATSELVQSCMVRYWSYFAYGRDTWENKQCNHDAIRREAQATNYSLKGIMMGIIHAQQFSTRVQVQ